MNISKDDTLRGRTHQSIEGVEYHAVGNGADAHVEHAVGGEQCLRGITHEGLHVAAEACLDVVALVVGCGRFLGANQFDLDVGHGVGVEVEVDTDIDILVTVQEQVKVE